MRQFLLVLESELKEYFSAKGFMIWTIIIAVLGAGLLCLPRFIDLSGFTGVQVVAHHDEQEAHKKDKEEREKLYLLDEAHITDMKVLEAYFPENEWVIIADEKALRQAVESQEAEAGFVIKAPIKANFIGVTDRVDRDHGYLLRDPCCARWPVPGREGAYCGGGGCAQCQIRFGQARIRAVYHVSEGYCYAP